MSQALNVPIDSCDPEARMFYESVGRNATTLRPASAEAAREPTLAVEYEDDALSVHIDGRQRTWQLHLEPSRMPIVSPPA